MTVINHQFKLKKLAVRTHDLFVISPNKETLILVGGKYKWNDKTTDVVLDTPIKDTSKLIQKHIIAHSGVSARSF
jgi:hypothetical protein